LTAITARNSNYEPNSFGGPKENPQFRERPKEIDGTVDRHNHRLDSDYYTQPGNLFRLMTGRRQAAPDRQHRASLSNVPRRIQDLQIKHFHKADPAYGTGVAKGLGSKSTKSLITKATATAAD